jgi:hypothetical protein
MLDEVGVSAVPALFKNAADAILRRDNTDALKAAPKVSKMWSYNFLKRTRKKSKRHDSNVMAPEISHMSSDGAQS